MLHVFCVTLYQDQREYLKSLLDEDFFTMSEAFRYIMKWSLQNCVKGNYYTEEQKQRKYVKMSFRLRQKLYDKINSFAEENKILQAEAVRILIEIYRIRSVGSTVCDLCPLSKLTLLTGDKINGKHEELEGAILTVLYQLDIIDQETFDKNFWSK